MLALKVDESARSSASAALLEALDLASAFHFVLLLLFLLFDNLSRSGSSDWSTSWSSRSAVLEHLSNVCVFESLGEKFWPVGVDIVAGSFNDSG